MAEIHLQRLLTIVEQALSIQDGQRDQFLQEACGGDSALRGDVDRLLESVGESESFWEDWSAWNERQMAEMFLEEATSEKALVEQRIGPWRLLRELGRGGMGSVWLAERADGTFRKRVALKLLHHALAHGLPGSTPFQRFQQERHILARLDHPGIARLIDGGVTDEGLPWLAMEYVDGRPITEWCRAENAPPRRRLQLFEAICEAIRYAHMNLVVHRDLKPENILVTEEGKVKILDFGIAKLLDDSLAIDDRIQTQTGLRAMTLNFAAPEQIVGEPVTTATDVYALGLLLYELLTGAHPHDLEGKNLRQIEQIVRLEEPPKPSMRLSATGPSFHRQGVRGDLDAITLKALRKEPEQRYENAGQLLEDLRRHRANMPVAARHGTFRYRLEKWLRRHRWAAAFGIAAAISLVSGAGIALWQAREARQSAGVATMALAESEAALSRATALQTFLLDLFSSAQPDRPRDQLPTTEEILALGAERALDEESAPPFERFGMLLTIGQVYREQHRIDDARVLLDAAIELARKHQGERPGDLALALRQKALIVMGLREFDEAEALLQEAETAVEGSESLWRIYADVRSDRVWGNYLKGEHERAIRLGESLYGALSGRTDIDDRLRIQVMRTMVPSHKAIGNLRTAALLSEEIIELVRRTEGPESQAFAVNLANSVDLDYNTGRFDVAESKARRALELYDQIYRTDQPTAYRAVARMRLATALLYVGRFDEALAEMDAASRERALARGRSPEQWEYYYHNRGAMLARMHRWPEAARDLRTARTLFVDPGEDDRSTLINLDAQLAWALCRQGETLEGDAILAELEARLVAGRSELPLQQALIHEARASCLLRNGAFEAAVREIDLALSAEEAYPGRAIYNADRLIVRARILASLGRQVDAEAALNRAERLYLDLGLAAHPHFAYVEAARRELF